MNSKNSSCCCNVNWSSAIMAGLIASIVMTLTMLLFGMNVMRTLGGLLMGSEASVASQYFAGGLMHLLVGVIYACIYAMYVAPWTGTHRVVKAFIYGTLLTVIAFFGMPVMAKALTKVRNADNPCMQGEVDGRLKRHHKGLNPCMNVGNGERVDPGPHLTGPSRLSRNYKGNDPAASADRAMAAMNPCGDSYAGNPCNPCSSAQRHKGMVIIWINYMVYALVLVFAYKGKKS